MTMTNRTPDALEVALRDFDRWLLDRLNTEVGTLGYPLWVQVARRWAVVEGVRAAAGTPEGPHTCGGGENPPFPYPCKACEVEAAAEVQPTPATDARTFHPSHDPQGTDQCQRCMIVVHETGADDQCVLADAPPEPPPDDELDIYVPAAWTCPACSCGLSQASMSAATGEVGITAQDIAAEPTCPNECGPMVRVRWRDRALEGEAAYVRDMTRLLSLTGTENWPAAFEVLEACQPYLREGETPDEALKRMANAQPTPATDARTPERERLKDLLVLADRHIAKVRLTDEGDEYCDGCGELWWSDDHDCVYRFIESLRDEVRAALPPAPEAPDEGTALELERIAAWIRSPGNIDTQDAVDECARVLENRARALRQARPEGQET